MSKTSFVVSLKEARYLHETEWLTKQDPFAVIWTTSTKNFKARTKTFKNGGKRATWEETFTLNVDDVATESFFLEIMNKNGMTPDKLIGRTKFACADIGYKSVETWVKIYGENGADAGEVKIAANRTLAPGEQPSEGQLQQKQQEAEDKKRALDEQVRVQQQKQRDDEQLRTQQQQRQEELGRDEEIKQLRRDEEIKQLRRDEEIRQLRRDEEIRQLRHDEEIRQLRRDEEIRQLRLDEEKKQLRLDEEKRQVRLDEEKRQRLYDEQVQMEQQSKKQNQAPSPTQRLPPSAPSSYILPPGWTSAIDPASNRTYYANKVTQKTQWVRPDEVVGTGFGSNVELDVHPLVYATAIENPAVAYQSTPLVPQQSYQQLQPQQQQPHLIPKQGMDLYQPAVSQVQQSQRTLQPNLYVSQQQLLSPLPPGWSQKMTPEGRPYYYNHISEKTTWERP